MNVTEEEIILKNSGYVGRTKEMLTNPIFTEAGSGAGKRIIKCPSHSLKQLLINNPGLLQYL